MKRKFDERYVSQMLDMQLEGDTSKSIDIVDIMEFNIPLEDKLLFILKKSINSYRVAKIFCVSLSEVLIPILDDDYEHPRKAIRMCKDCLDKQILLEDLYNSSTGVKTFYDRDEYINECAGLFLTLPLIFQCELYYMLGEFMNFCESSVKKVSSVVSKCPEKELYENRIKLFVNNFVNEYY